MARPRLKAVQPVGEETSVDLIEPGSEHDTDRIGVCRHRRHDESITVDEPSVRSRGALGDDFRLEIPGRGKAYGGDRLAFASLALDLFPQQTPCDGGRQMDSDGLYD